MKKREGKIPISILIIVSLITVILMFFEFRSKHKVKARYFEEKIAAAQLTQQCFNEVKKAIDSLHIPIDRINDPNETGLIGTQYSPITTERGDLNAKLTSTNPNLAALVVELIKKSSVKKGDTIAVSMTGSYPALNIAVISALEVLDLEPIVITSAGSSMWGANHPQFTYLDMEYLLYNQGLLSHHTKAASFGGEDDMGRGLSPAGREFLENAILRNNITILLNENLDDAIENRMQTFRSGKDIKLFINVGEHTTSWMSIDPGYGFIPAGHIKQGKGLIAQFSRSGISVINLDNIPQLAAKYGLPEAPIPLPDIGEGHLYYTYKYSITLAIISLLILVILLVTILRFNIDLYFKKEKK